MTKLFIFSLLLILGLCSSKAEYLTMHKLNFSENTFSFHTDSLGITHIDSSDITCPSSGNAPALPLLATEISIPGQVQHISTQVTYNPRLIKTNVTIAQSVPPVTSDTDPTKLTEINLSYPRDIFPDSVIQYVSSSVWDDRTTLHYLSSPFIYDSVTGNLYFLDSLELGISYQPILENENNYRYPTSHLSYLENPNSMTHPQNHIESSNNSIEFNSPIDYVIITSNALKDAFQPLLNWKNTKGVKTEILTTEYIQENYSGSDLQHKIKNCLFDLYRNSGLKYALLGGDDYIVPVRKCFAQVGDYKATDIPADLYYAAFDGTFNWDANGNGIYGEYEDNINLTPYIHISRLPLRTTKETVDVTKKILRYEQTGRISNSILMSGVQLHYTEESKSDSEIYANLIFKNYIEPFWGGQTVNFFDTNTDFSIGKEYDVTCLNLKNQLEKGHAFFSMSTHGLTNGWKMESAGYFERNDASNIKNDFFTVISTTACHTNAFDSVTEPCLSESFIRSSSNGIIAYLGSSRQGWASGSPTKSLQFSQAFEAKFFDHLFSPNTEGKHFGQIVAAMKVSMQAFSVNGPYRWLQFSLNPIGDSEMPIFIDTPQEFKKISLTTSEKSVKISTGTSDCSICITSTDDYGKTFFSFYRNVQSIDIDDCPTAFTVCITKEGFIPKVFSVNYLQNDTVEDNKEITADYVKIGSSVIPFLQNGNFTINRNGKLTIHSREVEMHKGITVEKGGTLTITNK